MNIEDVLRKGMDEEIGALSAILENVNPQKNFKHAEKLREEIDCKKTLLEISKNDF